MQDGFWEAYTPEGIVIQQGEYKMGVEEGKHILWYKSGNKKQEVIFEGGKLNGTIIEWYESGQKYKEKTMINGKEDGLYKTWYQNGNKKTEGYLKNGEPIKLIYYNEDGSVKETRVYNTKP